MSEEVTETISDDICRHSDTTLLDFSRPPLHFASRRANSRLWETFERTADGQYHYPVPLNDPPTRNLAPPRAAVFIAALNAGIPPTDATVGTGLPIHGWVNTAAEAAAIAPGTDPRTRPQRAIAQQVLERVVNGYVARVFTKSPDRKLMVTPVLLPDPTHDEVRAMGVAPAASDPENVSRSILHYLGHGMPMVAGDLWAVSSDFKKYVRTPLSEILPQIGSNSTFVIDAAGAGSILTKMPATTVQPVVLCATAAGETLPSDPFFPADVLTSCITSPLRIALLRHLRTAPSIPGLADHADRVAAARRVLVDGVAAFGGIDPGGEGVARPSKTHDPLSELYWILTQVIDTIAADTLPQNDYLRMFRNDHQLSAMMRGYILALRVLTELGRNPVSVPALPARAITAHPLWGSWDAALDSFFNSMQLMRDMQAVAQIMAEHSSNAAARIVAQQASTGGSNGASGATTPRGTRPAPGTAPSSAIPAPPPRATPGVPSRLLRPRQSGAAAAAPAVAPSARGRLPGMVGISGAGDGETPSSFITPHRQLQHQQKQMMQPFPPGCAPGATPGSGLGSCDDDPVNDIFKENVTPLTDLIRAAAAAARPPVPATVACNVLAQYVHACVHKGGDVTDLTSRLRDGLPYGPSGTLQIPVSEELAARVSVAARTLFDRSQRFFAFCVDQLRQFELRLATLPTAPARPRELCIVLQALRVPTLCLRAAVGLLRFVDLGPWAIREFSIAGGILFLNSAVQEVAEDASTYITRQPAFHHAVIAIFAKTAAADPSVLIPRFASMVGAGGVKLSTPLHIILSSALAPESPPDRRYLAMSIIATIARNDNRFRRIFLALHVVDAAALHLRAPQPAVRLWAALLCAAILRPGIAADDVAAAYGSVGTASRVMLHRLPLIVQRLATDPVPEIRAAGVDLVTCLAASKWAVDLQIMVAGDAQVPSAPSTAAPSGVNSPPVFQPAGFGGGAFSGGRREQPQPALPNTPAGSPPSAGPGVPATAPLPLLTPWLALAGDASSIVRRSVLTMLATVIDTYPAAATTALTNLLIRETNIPVPNSSVPSSSGTPLPLGRVFRAERDRTDRALRLGLDVDLGPEPSVGVGVDVSRPQSPASAAPSPAVHGGGTAPLGSPQWTPGAPPVLVAPPGTTAASPRSGSHAPTPAGMASPPAATPLRALVSSATVLEIITTCVTALTRLSTDADGVISARATGLIYLASGVAWAEIAARLGPNSPALAQVPEIRVTDHNLRELEQQTGVRITIQQPAAPASAEGYEALQPRSAWALNLTSSRRSLTDLHAPPTPPPPAAAPRPTPPPARLDPATHYRYLKLRALQVATALTAYNTTHCLSTPLHGLVSFDILLPLTPAAQLAAAGAACEILTSGSAYLCPQHSVAVTPHTHRCLVTAGVHGVSAAPLRPRTAAEVNVIGNRLDHCPICVAVRSLGDGAATAACTRAALNHGGAAGPAPRAASVAAATMFAPQLKPTANTQQEDVVTISSLLAHSAEPFTADTSGAASPSTFDINSITFGVRSPSAAGLEVLSSDGQHLLAGLGYASLQANVSARQAMQENASHVISRYSKVVDMLSHRSWQTTPGSTEQPLLMPYILDDCIVSEHHTWLAAAAAASSTVLPFSVTNSDTLGRAIRAVMQTPLPPTELFACEFISVGSRQPRQQQPAGVASTPNIRLTGLTAAVRSDYFLDSTTPPPTDSPLAKPASLHSVSSGFFARGVPPTPPAARPAPPLAPRAEILAGPFGPCSIRSSIDQLVMLHALVAVIFRLPNLTFVDLSLPPLRPCECERPSRIDMNAALHAEHLLWRTYKHATRDTAHLLPDPQSHPGPVTEGQQLHPRRHFLGPAVVLSSVAGSPATSPQQHAAHAHDHPRTTTSALAPMAGAGAGVGPVGAFSAVAANSFAAGMASTMAYGTPALPPPPSLGNAGPELLYLAALPAPVLPYAAGEALLREPTGTLADRATLDDFNERLLSTLHQIAPPYVEPFTNDDVSRDLPNFTGGDLLTARTAVDVLSALGSSGALQLGLRSPPAIHRLPAMPDFAADDPALEATIDLETMSALQTLAFPAPTRALQCSTLVTRLARALPAVVKNDPKLGAFTDIQVVCSPLAAHAAAAAAPVVASGVLPLTPLTCDFREPITNVGRLAAAADVRGGQLARSFWAEMPDDTATLCRDRDILRVATPEGGSAVCLAFHDAAPVAASADTRGNIYAWNTDDGSLLAATSPKVLQGDLDSDWSGGDRDWRVSAMAFASHHLPSTIVTACTDGCVRVLRNISTPSRTAVAACWRMNSAQVSTPVATELMVRMKSIVSAPPPLPNLRTSLSASTLLQPDDLSVGSVSSASTSMLPEPLAAAPLDIHPTPFTCSPSFHVVAVAVESDVVLFDIVCEARVATHHMPAPVAHLELAPGAALLIVTLVTGGLHIIDVQSPANSCEVEPPILPGSAANYSPGDFVKGCGLTGPAIVLGAAHAGASSCNMMVFDIRATGRKVVSEWTARAPVGRRGASPVRWGFAAHKLASTAAVNYDINGARTLLSYDLEGNSVGSLSYSGQKREVQGVSISPVFHPTKLVCGVPGMPRSSREVRDASFFTVSHSLAKH